MQGPIEDAIQPLGYVILQLSTLGSYGPVRPKDPVLLEGATGFALLAAAAFIVYRGVS